ncbi:MAG TPA: ATP-binding protein [Solirubrobacteraceae bacterium]|nr:ATP-binding protein [Solirubrobacteraceae bacterium]
MAELAELLGQNRTADGIWADLQEPDVRVVRLTGPSGSGKSFIARHIATRWREAGGSCVVAVGDDDNSWRELYPLLTGLSSAHRDWTDLAVTGARSAVRIAETATGAPPVGTSIFDLLNATFRQRTGRALQPYSDSERAIILDLNHLSRSRDVLLVADNAHWWDTDSLQLLRSLLSDRLRKTLSSLDSMVVLVVDTADEQSAVDAEKFDVLVAMCKDRTHRTERCDRRQFRELLEVFAYKGDLPDDALRLLFDVTGGHLKLVEQVTAYAMENENLSLLTSKDGDFLASLARARFASLGTWRPEVTELLVQAAVLGLSCTERDLQCISDKKRAEIQNLVELADKIGFVAPASGEISFCHDIIRTAILRDQSPQHLRPIYEKLTQCLSILRPGDYSSRARALLEADDRENAREMIALAGVSQIRRGVDSTRVWQRITSRAPADTALHTHFKVIADGYAAVEAGDFSRAIPGLRTSLAGETPCMAAERNYLAAICSMELQTTDGAVDAQSILKSWLPRLRNEAELRIRFLLLLQQAQVLANMLEEARRTESRTEQLLLERSGYDPDAVVMLQVQNRRAGAVNTPEVAKTRIAEAVEFFRRGTGDGTRDRLELFRALNNLTSMEIRLGRFDASYRHACEAEQLAAESPDSVHRLDVFANNFVLAAYRSDAINLDEAIVRQRQIIDSPEGSGDKLLQRINLAGFLLLAGQDDEGVARLTDLEEEMRTGDLDESYLHFYVYSTAVSGAAFRGDLDDAQRRHSERDKFVEEIRWPGAPYVRRRHELVAKMLPTFDHHGARADADGMFLQGGRIEIGPAWSYYGRLVPPGSLNFWSDS